MLLRLSFALMDKLVPSAAVTSFLLGGYKFFVMPSEYFVPPMAAKQAS
jgi:hypothetical protein